MEFGMVWAHLMEIYSSHQLNKSVHSKHSTDLEPRSGACTQSPHPIWDKEGYGLSGTGRYTTTLESTEPLAAIPENQKIGIWGNLKTALGIWNASLCN